MRKQVRSWKKFFIKSLTVLTVVLCLQNANTSMLVFAEEDDGLHNVSENDISDPDTSENDENTEEQKEIKDDTEKEESEEESNEKTTVSDNSISDNNLDATEKGIVAEKEENDEIAKELEIINVVVPTTYTLAMNPYELSIRTGEGTSTTKQIVSGTYGIVNKSSTDQIVTVSLTVEDNNGGVLIFADSAEDARNAGQDVYAIYLTAVPANEEQIMIDGKPVDNKVSGEDLRNVEMTAAKERAVALYNGDNQMTFKLGSAVYNQENEIIELAPNGAGVTAYTFDGVMNANAAWEKLSGGIKLSVVYTYQTADGSEEIVEGTGAMIQED